MHNFSKKRILSLILTLCMVVTLVTPAVPAVYAEDGEVEEHVHEYDAQTGICIFEGCEATKPAEENETCEHENVDPLAEVKAGIPELPTSEAFWNDLDDDGRQQASDVLGQLLVTLGELRESGDLTPEQDAEAQELEQTLTALGFAYLNDHPAETAIEVHNQCGDNLYYHYIYPEDELIFRGYGDMYNYPSAGPWYSLLTAYPITKIRFEEDGGPITSIGDHAFHGSSGQYKNITFVNLEDLTHLEKIGDYAFAYCATLSSFNLEDMTQLKKIGDFAFYNCTGLSSIYIPGELSEVGADVFGCCTNLETVTFGEGTSSVGQNMFYNCESLTDLSFPKGLRVIPSGVCGECYNLQSVTIPASVEEIEKDAFWCCYNLTEINFEPPSKLQTIGEYALGGTNITEIVFPPTITVYPKELFDGEGEDTYPGTVKIDLSGLTEEDIRDYIRDLNIGDSGSDWVEDVIFVWPSDVSDDLWDELVDKLEGLGFNGLNENDNREEPSVTYDSVETYVRAYADMDQLDTDSFCQINDEPEDAPKLALNGEELPVTGFGKADENIYWAVCDTTLYIEGSGGCIERDIAWWELHDFNCLVTSIVCSGENLRIGEGAFNDFPELQCVIMPSVVALDDGAFADCYNLQEIYFGETEPQLLGEGQAFWGITATCYTPEWLPEGDREHWGCAEKLTWLRGTKAAAKIGNVTYETVVAAIEAAANNATTSITVLDTPNFDFTVTKSGGAVTGFNITEENLKKLANRNGLGVYAEGFGKAAGLNTFSEFTQNSQPVHNGGQLRLPADGSTTYESGDTFNLRFAYFITLPAGLDPAASKVNWSWELSFGSTNMGTFVKKAYKAVAGQQNMYQSNVVITNIPEDYYETEFKSIIKVNMTIDDVQYTVSREGFDAETPFFVRSVKDIAVAFKDSNEYCRSIVGVKGE